MVRVFLDTETTGLSTVKGDAHGSHRIVEIGCVKTCNGVVTEKFHCYINPERDVPEVVVQIHGLTRDFLQQYPSFSKHYEKFLSFIQNHVLVIHNARFDMAFLNWELARINQPILENAVEDTLVLARKKFPGSPASLDALCRRFRINLLKRSFHGALLDAELLCSVYHEMCKEQTSLDFQANVTENAADEVITKDRPLRVFPIADAERISHEEIMRMLKESDVKQ